MISETSKGLVPACHDANLAFSSSRAVKTSLLSLFPSELLWLMRWRREAILSTIPGAMTGVRWGVVVVCIEQPWRVRATKVGMCVLLRSSRLPHVFRR